MPSPFPGMNPYLERPGSWGTFKRAFCAKCMELLVRQVVGRYIVQLERDRYVCGSVSGSPSGPMRIDGESFIVIKDRQRRSVITIIELLTPTCKEPGVFRECYLTKRANWLTSEANLVEIDL